MAALRANNWGARLRLKVARAAKGAICRSEFGMLTRVLTLSLVLALTSCRADPPDLVHVFDATPREVERNDSLVVRGSGYPPGETGLLELDGTLHRAGAEPDRSFSFTAELTSETDERAVVLVDDRMVAAFTQSEDGARHATFRGTATVAFPAGLEGAPPIQGKGAVVIDVYPTGASEDSRSDDLERFYGAEFGLGTAGIVVQALVPDGRLHRAAVEAGDQILSFEGLSALRPSDLEPFPGQRAAALQVRSAEAGEHATGVATWVDTEGYRPLPARPFRWGLALVIPTALWLCLSHAPFMHTLLWLLGLWSRGKDREGADARQARPERVPLGFVPFLATSACFAASDLELIPALGDLDLILLYASVALLEFAIAFLRGGRRAGGFSPWRGALALFAHLPLQLCVALAFLALAVERASLGLSNPHDTFSWQGGPWGSPTSFLVCFVLGTLAFGRSTRATPEVLSQSSSLLLLGGLVVLFFGGTDAPSWIRAGKSSGLLWFELKFTLAYLGWLFAQRGLERLRVSLPPTVVSRLLLPVAVLALALGPVWLADVWPEWLRDCVRAGLAGTIAAFLVATAALVLGRDRSNDGLGTTNPWL